MSRPKNRKFETYLQDQQANGKIEETLYSALLALSRAAKDIAKLASENGLGSAAFLGALTGAENTDGDSQKALDVLADDLICSALSDTPISAYLSEERDEAVCFNKPGRWVVACDPLDGSSNIDTNLTIGTIFSIYQAGETGWLMAGRAQKAAGFFAYGPQTVLLLTIGDGVAGFCLDETGVFMEMDWQPEIMPTTSEFAINAANRRFWPAHITQYIEGLLAGADGPRGQNFNMRWNGSLVADAYRIFRRGGIFLYPEDSRKGYEAGRLRLVYEANPIAYLVEQAGGKASDGQRNILDIQPESYHMRIPFIFGSRDEVDRVPL